MKKWLRNLAGKHGVRLIALPAIRWMRLVQFAAVRFYPRNLRHDRRQRAILAAFQAQTLQHGQTGPAPQRGLPIIGKTRVRDEH